MDESGRDRDEGFSEGVVEFRGLLEASTVVSFRDKIGQVVPLTYNVDGKPVVLGHGKVVENPDGSIGFEGIVDHPLVEEIFGEAQVEHYSIASPDEELYLNPPPAFADITAEVIREAMEKYMSQHSLPPMEQQRQDSKEMMDRAKQHVLNFVHSYYGSNAYPGLTVEDDVYVVWFNKTLKNWKALLSTNIKDGIYYEVTYNGERNETYVDAYKHLANIVVPGLSDPLGSNPEFDQKFDKWTNGQD